MHAEFTKKWTGHGTRFNRLPTYEFGEFENSLAKLLPKKN